jgi:hypothetical protein
MGGFRNDGVRPGKGSDFGGGGDCNRLGFRTDGGDDCGGKSARKFDAEADGGGVLGEECGESRCFDGAEGGDVLEVQKQLLQFVEQYFGKEIILAGNSIHQDRKFIDREWPELAQRLHYRMLDVSAWKVYFEGAKGKKFVKREAHRALDDIQGSIEELKWYLSFMKGTAEC